MSGPCTLSPRTVRQDKDSPGHGNPESSCLACLITVWSGKALGCTDHTCSEEIPPEKELFYKEALMPHRGKTGPSLPKPQVRKGSLGQEVCTSPGEKEQVRRASWRRVWHT